MDTSVPTAEFGRGGATMNVSYKSGTRDFHGDLFEFFRNSDLDARNFFDPTGPVKPFHMNQYGATLGGPITTATATRHSSSFPGKASAAISPSPASSRFPRPP